jgi:hypothetical protein
MLLYRFRPVSRLAPTVTSSLVPSLEGCVLGSLLLWLMMEQRTLKSFTMNMTVC